MRVSESHEFPSRPRPRFRPVCWPRNCHRWIPRRARLPAGCGPIVRRGSGPPLAEDNQTRVYLDVEKPDKITRVACDDDKVIFESVVPDFRVRFAGQTDMCCGHSKHTLIAEFADQRRRNMFVQQYANQRRAPGSLSIRKCFFGRPGGCPSRAASRA